MRAGRLIAAELKKQTGRVERDQREWLEDLEACIGVSVHVWRPSDLRLVRDVLR